MLAANISIRESSWVPFETVDSECEDDGRGTATSYKIRTKSDESANVDE